MSNVCDTRADEALLLAVRGGDKAALGQLYDRYASLLSAVAMRLLGNTAEVEDLIHDVFIEVWRKAHSYSPERGEVRAWLVVKTRSRALDRQRRGSRRPERLSTGEPEHVEAWVGGESLESPAQSALASQLRDRVLSLPETDREVLLLSYFKGLSIEEIATTISIPTGTVKSRLYHARQRLREAWEAKPTGRTS